MTKGEMLSTTTKNETNLYGNFTSMIGGGGVAPAESLLPFQDCQIRDAVLQQATKSMNYRLSNPPLKDDSGLAFNNYALPLPRKRFRDSSMVNNNCSSSNSVLISVPNGKVSSQCPGVASGGSLSFLGEDFSLQLMQQQLEADRLISLHMEKVRAEIEERTRNQSIRVIQAIQEAIGRKLRDTEGQIEKIGKLNWELEERVKSLCLENQIWRDLAQSNETTANALRSNLEQVLLQSNNNYNDDRIFSGAGAGSATDDAESCCGSSGHGIEEDVLSLRWRKVARTSASGGETKQVMAEVEEEERRKRMCRRCAAAECSVLLLPCRHLCLCAACSPAVDACPVCNATKNASVHINLS